MGQNTEALIDNNVSLKEYSYAQLYESSPFAFRVIDYNYVVIDINQSFIHLLSEIIGRTLTKADILGRCCYDILGEAVPCPDCLLLKSISENKTSLRKKSYPMLYDRTFEVYTQPLMQDNGTIYGVIELVIDVTAQKSFDDLINVLSDAIYIIDIETRKILVANQAACKTLGYSLHEILNLRLEDVDPNYNETVFNQLIANMVSGNQKSFLIETINKDASGTLFPVEVNTSVINFHGRKALIGVNRDIRERKHVEKMARDADEQLMRLDRLNLLGEMAASISHEIRNPLTTVRGFLQLFKKKNDFSGTSYNEYFDTMIEEIDRANSIITEFLSLAKNKKTDLDLNNINLIISKIYPLMHADALKEEKSIILELGEVPNIRLDENQIRQCILNLVRNGLDAVNKTGNVSIKTYKDATSVVLEIKDNGCGISQDILDKFGTPFNTTKDNGTGLGIPICYRIAERHNAEIEIATNTLGTTVSIKFKHPDD